MYRLLLIVFLAISVNVSAQVHYTSRLSASLKLFLAEGSTDKRYIIEGRGEKYIPVFFELAPGSSIAELQKQGIVFRTVIKEIATADIPLSQLEKIAALPGVRRIELPLFFRKTDSLMKKLTTVDRVHRGDTPLDKTYTGKNTLIGIIDDGADITHPDFADSTGKTRIRYLWNMDYAGTPPAGQSYGHEWPADSIDAYRLRYKNREVHPVQMKQYFGHGFHGTPVTGLAAGNSGIAPGADIVSVALTAFGDTILRSDRIVDGIAYIYSKAQELGKKCVVNISMGLMEGAPHDGKSLVERAIDNFCIEKPDILVCVSAGNNGNTWKHWGGFPIHRDSSFCFFRVAYSGSLYFAIPRHYSHTISVSVTDSKMGNLSSPNISRDSIIYQTPYWKISDLVQQPGPVTMSGFFPNGILSSTIRFSASHYNDDYDELIIHFQEHSSNGSNFIDHLGRFIFKGTGYVHGWYPFLNLHPPYVFDMNPYPNDSTFRKSDNDFTTVIPSHAFTVLSSGAYNTRDCYVNMMNQAIYTYQTCRLTYFTSRGPTLDGRIKPDIITPGDYVISPRSRMETFYGHEFDLDSNHLAFSGTSASSPITAGIAALVWERFPEYIRDSVINQIKSTAFTDNFTNSFGPVPNNVAGWGKADAFRALTGVATDRQSFCHSLTCTTDVTTNPPPQSNEGFVRIYPNPVQGTVFLRYTSVSPLQLFLYNSAGQLLLTKTLPAGNSLNDAIHLDHAAAGIYYMKVTGNKSITKPLIVMH